MLCVFLVRKDQLVYRVILRIEDLVVLRWEEGWHEFCDIK